MRSNLHLDQSIHIAQKYFLDIISVVEFFVEISFCVVLVMVKETFSGFLKALADVEAVDDVGFEKGYAGLYWEKLRC